MLEKQSLLPRPNQKIYFFTRITQPRFNSYQINLPGSFLMVNLSLNKVFFCRFFGLLYISYFEKYLVHLHDFVKFYDKINPASLCTGACTGWLAPSFFEYESNFSTFVEKLAIRG